MLIFADKNKQELQKEIFEQIQSSVPEEEEKILDFRQEHRTKNYGFKKIPLIKLDSNNYWELFVTNDIKNLPTKLLSFEEIKSKFMSAKDPDDIEFGEFINIEKYNNLVTLVKADREYWQFIINSLKIIRKYQTLLLNYQSVIRGFINEQGFDRYIFTSSEQIKKLTDQIFKYQEIIKNLIENYKKITIKMDDIFSDFFVNFPNKFRHRYFLSELFDENSITSDYNYRDDDLYTEIGRSNNLVNKINEDILNVFTLKNFFKVKEENVPINYEDKNIRMKGLDKDLVSFLINFRKILSIEEINFCLSYAYYFDPKDTRKARSSIVRQFEDRKDVFKIAKEIGKTFNNKETIEEFLFSAYQKLYLKYGKPFEEIYKKDNNYHNMNAFEALEKNPKDNKILLKIKGDDIYSISGIINPTFAKNLYKWMLSKNPQAIILANEIYESGGRHLSIPTINCILTVYPNFDVQSLKNNYSLFEELKKLINKIDGNIYHYSEIFNPGRNNFTMLNGIKAQNLNQVKNILLKLDLIFRAIHNSGNETFADYLETNFPGFFKSILTAQWDPTQDIINKFLNIIFNDKIQNIFSVNSEALNSNYSNEYRYENINYYKDIAFKLNINLDNLRQDIERLYSFFVNGVQIPFSYKEKIYKIDDNINNLLNYHHIEEYVEKAQPKNKTLFNLNCQIKDYNFYVLPDYSPEHFQVGAVTNCCQRIGGVGENAAIDSFINPLAGVLVLKKNNDLIAQSYFHYVPEDNGYILDNVESNEGNVAKYKTDLNMLYALLANKIKSEFGINYFKCGKEYNKLNNNYFKSSTFKHEKNNEENDEEEYDPRHFEVDSPYSDFDEEDHLDLLKPNFYVPEIKVNFNSLDFIKEKQNTHKFYQKLLEIKQKMQ